MRSHVAILGALALAASASSASAAEVFFTDFNSVAVPDHSFIVVPTVEGWNTLAGPGIELQDNVAGAPPSGLLNDNFVELDSFANSVMGRIIAAAGDYHLTFQYSPRPGVAEASNIIIVAVDGAPLITLAQPGGAQTNWQTFSFDFAANAGAVLTFAASGTNDALGGYLDNIRLETAAVPEPAAWALMLLGFGGLGAMLRSRRTAAA
jgi:hypothetical protein